MNDEIENLPVHYYFPVKWEMDDVTLFLETVVRGLNEHPFNGTVYLAQQAWPLRFDCHLLISRWIRPSAKKAVET